MLADQPNKGGHPVHAIQEPIFTSNVPVPPKIELSGNLAINWKQWKQVWSAYDLVTLLNEHTAEYRVAAIITCIGPKALTIHNDLPFQSEAETKNLAKILELWESYYLGRANIIYERYRFNKRDQEAGESIDTYASNLRSLSDTCNYGALNDEMIRDRIVCGVRERFPILSSSPWEGKIKVSSFWKKIFSACQKENIFALKCAQKKETAQDKETKEQETST